MRPAQNTSQLARVILELSANLDRLRHLQADLAAQARDADDGSVDISAVSSSSWLTQSSAAGDNTVTVVTHPQKPRKLSRAEVDAAIRDVLIHGKISTVLAVLQPHVQYLCELGNSRIHTANTRGRYDRSLPLCSAVCPNRQGQSTCFAGRCKECPDITRARAASPGGPVSTGLRQATCRSRCLSTAVQRTNEFPDRIVQVIGYHDIVRLPPVARYVLSGSQPCDLCLRWYLHRLLRLYGENETAFLRHVAFHTCRRSLRAKLVKHLAHTCTGNAACNRSHCLVSGL